MMGLTVLRQEGNTPLHKAASHNGCKAAGLLLQANAKVNAKNNVTRLSDVVPLNALL